MNQMKQRILSALDRGKSITANQLAKRVKVARRQRGFFFRALDELVEEGSVTKRSGRFSLPSKEDLVPAEIVKVNATFGFATPTDGGDDVFIPGRFLLGGVPGDQVLLEVSRSSSGDLKEGKVIQITKEENRRFAATVVEGNGGRWMIEPDRYIKLPLEIDRRSPVLARPGDKVLAQLSHRGKSHFDHRAEVLEVYGDGERASVSAQAILGEHGIHPEFPPEVLKEARNIERKGIHPKEKEARVDLRDRIIFTIDGADTKDIDDAISIQKHEDGFTLGVHIADVSYYVLADSLLDQEAFERGTSVYFADSVVPMLPPELSNGICSLNQGEDRLAFSVHMNISPQGELKDFVFEKTMINSALQGVYSEINSLLEGDATPALEEKYQQVMPSLLEMQELANILTDARMRRGGIHLESTESKITVDEDGVAVDVRPRVSGQTEGFIEEFMLMANQAAATFALEKTLPFIYRIHESPDPDRLEGLYDLLDSLGISYHRSKGGKATAKSLDAVLEQVKNTDLSGIVNNVMLRTMAKARYSPDNLGHFGLGLDNYAHFTSPIRRYPDLAIHRILTSLLIGMRRDNIDKRYSSWVTIASRQSSVREVEAQTAERSAEDCYKAEYLSAYVGEEFEGVVSTATGFGAFVQLPNTVEGLVSLSDFPESGGTWEYDNLISFKSSVGGKTLRVGDKVTIQVAKTNVAMGQIDFIFTQIP